MNSEFLFSTPRRAVLLRTFFTAIALAFLLFVPSHAFAFGSVSLTTNEPEESDGKWKLVFKINYGTTPDIAYIPMIFSFTPTMIYERSLTDQSPEKPVITRLPLQNQVSMNESMDVGFSNAEGKKFKETKFDFVIKRSKGFEAGEYDLKITRADDGAQVGNTIKLKLRGDNPIVDRRAMVFSGTKRKPEEKKDDKGEEKKDGEGDSSSGSSDSGDSSASSDTPTEAPPATPPKQGGCGCRVADESAGSTSAFAVLLLGAAIAWRRRVHH